MAPVPPSPAGYVPRKKVINIANIDVISQEWPNCDFVDSCSFCVVSCRCRGVQAAVHQVKFWGW